MKENLKKEESEEKKSLNKDKYWVRKNWAKRMREGGRNQTKKKWEWQLRERMGKKIKEEEKKKEKRSQKLFLFFFGAKIEEEKKKFFRFCEKKIKKIK